MKDTGAVEGTVIQSMCESAGGVPIVLESADKQTKVWKHFLAKHGSDPSKETSIAGHETIML